MNISQLKDHNYKIFIDTATLMEESFINYFNDIEPELKARGTGLIVIDRVITELKGLSNGSETRNKAKAGLELIKYGEVKGVIAKMQGSDSAGKADGVFQAIFTRFRDRNNLCLLTQDQDLAKDILKLNVSKSVHDIKTIRVYKMNRLGDMEQVTLKEDSLNHIIKSQIIPFKASRIPVDKEYYKPLKISKIPTSGDIVHSEKKLKIKIDKKIASGGEGDVYQFKVMEWKKSPEASAVKYVAKIYHEGVIDKAKIEKIKLIINNKSCHEIEGVCFPISLLYNENNEPVGYTMKKAGGVGGKVFDLQRSLFIKPLAKKKLRGWHRINLVTLCINILNKINALHQYNIIIGDLNYGNILFDKNANVYFIDTDSYQVENYPCPVGTATFSHPDILTDLRKKNFKSFLRTKDHERFAVSTLLFTILLPGLSPYAFKGGSNPAANVKTRNFVFPFIDKSKGIHHVRKELADGQWRFIWSHLPFALKEAFYETFHEGKMRKINDYKIDERADTSNLGWINVLNKYEHMLKNNRTSNELYPSSFKIIKTINNPPKKTIELLQKDNGAITQKIERDTRCSIYVALKNNIGIIRISSLDNGRAEVARQSIENIEETILSDTVIISMKDIFPIEFKDEIEANKKHYLKSCIYGPGNLYLEDFISKYQDEILVITKTGDDWHLRAHNRERSEEISINFIKYCNTLFSKIKISTKIHLKHIIGENGKNIENLERECKKIEKDESFKGKSNHLFIAFENSDWNYLWIDSDSRNLYIFSRNSNVRKYVKSEISKTELKKKWGSYKKIYIPKKSIHSILNHSLFIAIEMKYKIASKKDYLIKDQGLTHMMKVKKPFIMLYSKNVDIQQDIIDEINNVIKWKNSDRILIPNEIQNYLNNNNLDSKALLTLEIDKPQKTNTSLRTIKVKNKLFKSLLTSPFEYYVRVDKDKKNNWFKKNLSSGEIIIRTKFKKHLKLISNLIKSRIKQILDE